MKVPEYKKKKKNKSTSGPFHTPDIDLDRFRDENGNVKWKPVRRILSIMFILLAAGIVNIVINSTRQVTYKKVYAQPEQPTDPRLDPNYVPTAQDTINALRQYYYKRKIAKIDSIHQLMEDSLDCDCNY